MKRLIVRLLVLSGIVALGWFAISHAQRWREQSADKSAAKGQASAQRAAPKPIPDDREGPPRGNNGLAGTGSLAKASGLLAKMETHATAGRDVPDDLPARNAKKAARPAEWQQSVEQGQDEGARPNQDPFSAQAKGGRFDPQVRQAAAVGSEDRYPQGDPAAENDRYTAGQSDPPADAAYPDGSSGGARPAELPINPAGAAAQQIDDAGGEPAATEPDNFAPPAQRPGTDRPQQDFADPAAAGDPAADAFARPTTRGPATDEGTGRPGAPQLEGSQTPSLTIEKVAPAEIQVGKPATFTIKVRNTGATTAQGVEIHDEVPRGTQLVSTIPKATRDPNGQLIWDLGVIKPKGEAQVEMQLMPVAEGEIGSVATVHFRAGASARSKSTKPQLVLEVAGPAKTMIGENVPLKIKISNPGSGTATGVVLTETVPAGLKHNAGSELEFEIGKLKPGESRELDLTLKAAKPGAVSNVLVAHADANLQAESQLDLEVLAPDLKVALNGPKRRYLERNATYNVQITNPGTAVAKDVELVAVLPKGLKFVEANNSGQYDPASRSVYWRLEELPPAETGSVALTLLPIEQGEFKLQIKGKSKQGLADDHEETISVEGLAAIMFELVDAADPIEVGGETTYEVRVINQGSKAATNLRLVAILPADMKPVSAEGPVNNVVDGQRVLFDPLTQLAPKADTTYSIKAQGLKPGDMRIRVQLLSDELSTPITKEESTRVYADE